MKISYSLSETLNRRTGRRLLAFLCALFLLFSGCDLTAVAAEEPQPDQQVELQQPEGDGAQEDPVSEPENPEADTQQGSIDPPAEPQTEGPDAPAEDQQQEPENIPQAEGPEAATNQAGQEDSMAPEDPQQEQGNGTTSEDLQQGQESGTASEDLQQEQESGTTSEDPQQKQENGTQAEDQQAQEPQKTEGAQVGGTENEEPANKTENDPEQETDKTEEDQPETDEGQEDESHEIPVDEEIQIGDSTAVSREDVRETYKIRLYVPNHAKLIILMEGNYPFALTVTDEDAEELNEDSVHFYAAKKDEETGRYTLRAVGFYTLQHSYLLEVSLAGEAAEGPMEGSFSLSVEKSQQSTGEEENSEDGNTAPEAAEGSGTNEPADETGSTDGEGNDGATLPEDGEEENSEDTEETVYAETLTTEDGLPYRISVAVNNENGIPANARLEVIEIAEGDGTYDALYRKTREALTGRTVEAARAFGIALVNPENPEEHYQPLE